MVGERTRRDKTGGDDRVRPPASLQNGGPSEGGESLRRRRKRLRGRRLDMTDRKRTGRTLTTVRENTSLSSTGLAGTTASSVDFAEGETFGAAVTVGSTDGPFGEGTGEDGGASVVWISYQSGSQVNNEPW